MFTNAILTNLFHANSDAIWFDAADHFFDKLEKQNTEAKRLYAQDSIYEADTEYLVEIELPGVKKESINVDIDGEYLKVSAKKEKQDGKVAANSRSYGEFSKKYHILTPVDGESISAKFEDGVLSITIPKAESAKPRKVVIG